MVNDSTKYKKLIMYIKNKWKLEVKNNKSPFYNIKNLTKFIKDNGFRKSKRQLTYKISRTILYSISEKGLCYYTTNSIAEHFKVTKNNTRIALKNLSSCLNIAFIKINSDYLFENELPDKRRFLIIPPNMVNDLCKTNGVMEISNRRFKVTNCKKTNNTFLYKITTLDKSQDYIFYIKS